MNSQHFVNGLCEWPTMLLSTKTNKLHSSLTPVTITEREASSQGKVLGAKPTTEMCSLLHVMLPASLSVVNTACVVYGNVGHLFVVLFGIRPQVEVNDCRVDAACLCISLQQQLAQMLFNQLHRPNGTTSDLNLSPVPWTKQLAWEKWEANTLNTNTNRRFCQFMAGETNACTLLSHHS